jgi:hypothetical protein
MSTRVYTTVFTIPAGTAIAAPLSQAIALENNILDSLDVTIPDGHVGLTGLAVFWSGTQIFPYQGATWINGNNERIGYAYDAEITQNGLSLVGYNTDIYPHSFYLRWYVSDLDATPPVANDLATGGGAPSPADAGTIAGLSGSVAPLPSPGSVSPAASDLISVPAAVAAPPGI